MTTIGFTGSRHGMTIAQARTVSDLVGLFTDVDGATQARHGVCKGADIEFHFIAKQHGLRVIGHPGVSVSGDRAMRGDAKCDETMPEKGFIDRNHDIVDASDVLIATPKSRVEEIRSGTWATVRYARKVGKRVAIVWPDGKVQDNIQ